MSDFLTQALQTQLAKYDITIDQWRELIQRLLDYSVLCRDDSLVEAEFYDRYVRIEPIVDDFLSLIGISLQHERHFRFVRVYPPAAKLPGADTDTSEGVNTALRLRLSQHEIALILVLRAEYDKSLRDGSIDEAGCATLSIEALALSLKTLLKRSLPDLINERRQYFRRLRQMRLINYANESDLDTGDGWLQIRPTIISVVSNEWLATVAAGLAGEVFTETPATDVVSSNSLFADQ